jgi:CheY-like chemotaxis protein
MLLDMQMPEMSGIEVIKQVKRLINRINNDQDVVIIVDPEFVIVTAYVT